LKVDLIQEQIWKKKMLATAITTRLIESGYNIFGDFEKPIRCMIHDADCPDCRDHEKTLKNATRKTLSINDLGTVAWDPVPNLNAHAMSYFLPRLIEFAVTRTIDCDGDPYMMRFINTVLGGPDCERFRLLGEEHKYLVFQVLLYLRAHYLAMVKDECWDQELDMAINRWRSASQSYSSPDVQSNPRTL
jgi:hypothetical protein